MHISIKDLYSAATTTTVKVEQITIVKDLANRHWYTDRISNSFEGQYTNENELAEIDSIISLPVAQEKLFSKLYLVSEHDIKIPDCIWMRLLHPRQGIYLNSIKRCSAEISCDLFYLFAKWLLLKHIPKNTFNSVNHGDVGMFHPLSFTLWVVLFRFKLYFSNNL